MVTNVIIVTHKALVPVLDDRKKVKSLIDLTIIHMICSMGGERSKKKKEKEAFLYWID